MPPSALDVTGLTKNCTPGATVPLGKFTLENNTWGANEVSTFSQCILYSPATVPTPQYGWSWTYPQEAEDDVKAYPEIEYGKKPWAAQSTTPNLPQQLSAIGSLQVDFTAQLDVNGRYNLSFDLWLTNSAAATVGSITHEVMIWVANDGGPTPAGDPTATLTILGNPQCDLWVGSIDASGSTPEHPYLAFVFQEPFLSGSIDLVPYLNYLLQQQLIPADAYLASVEFGNEVWYGSGTTLLTSYQITSSATPPMDAP